MPRASPASSAIARTGPSPSPLGVSGGEAGWEIESVGSPSRTFSSWRTRSASVCAPTDPRGARESCARVSATARSISGRSSAVRLSSTACT